MQCKGWLARIMPRVESRLMFLDPIPAHGRRLFELACERDLEGIVAKHRRAPYSQDPTRTSWCQIKNPDYTQAIGRHELFAARSRGARRNHRNQPLALTL